MVALFLFLFVYAARFDSGLLLLGVVCLIVAVCNYFPFQCVFD